MAKKKVATKETAAALPMARGRSKNMPEVSKQTAGGIGGAVVGGLVGGPVGALIGGVAGAMMGNASAEGKRPVKKAVEAVRENLSGAAGQQGLGRKKAADKKSAKSGGSMGAVKKSKGVKKGKKALTVAAGKKSAAKSGGKKKPATKKNAKASSAKGAKKSATRKGAGGKKK
jgi:hypothetical protein